jgi:hypothetical protein
MVLRALTLWRYVAEIQCSTNTHNSRYLVSVCLIVSLCLLQCVVLTTDRGVLME